MSPNVCQRCALVAKSTRHATSWTVRPIYSGLHTSASKAAQPLPVTSAGPPPPAPAAAASSAYERAARKLKQAELLKRGKELRQEAKPSSSPSKSGGALKKRFWNDVHVKQQEDGTYVISLDQRPVRTPQTKTALPIPSSKPHLATAIALEWDSLTSAQQALKGHNIPLTSLAARAKDLELEDAKTGSSGLTGPIRKQVVSMMLRYLDTDTLLCWAPERSSFDGNAENDQSAVPRVEGRTASLRQQQVLVTQEIIGYLTTTVWPGVTINPVLDTDSIIPAAQPEGTRDVIRGWLTGLPGWELAGLERAVLATKSLCVATRFLIDWSEAFRDLNKDAHSSKTGRFGIEEAAHACSLEVTWQIARWGEVEDTHDVEKEDLKMQLGSVALLVGGTK